MGERKSLDELIMEYYGLEGIFSPEDIGFGEKKFKDTIEWVEKNTTWEAAARIVLAERKVAQLEKEIRNLS